MVTVDGIWIFIPALLDFSNLVETAPAYIDGFDVLVEELGKGLLVHRNVTLELVGRKRRNHFLKIQLQQPS